jgi:hypothetical protein
MDDEQSFDLDAAGVRADGHELSVGLEVLAGKLEAALPAATHVERRRKRMLSRDKVVESIEVRLDDCRYVIRAGRAGADAVREQEVRGVVIRREPLELGAWVGALESHLRELAGSSDRARAALERLLAG